MALVNLFIEKDGKEYLVAAIIDEILGDGGVRVPEDQYEYLLTDSYIEVAGREERLIGRRDAVEYLADVVSNIIARYPEVAEKLGKYLAKKRPEALERLRKALEEKKQ